MKERDRRRAAETEKGVRRTTPPFLQLSPRRLAVYGTSITSVFCDKVLVEVGDWSWCRFPSGRVLHSIKLGRNQGWDQPAASASLRRHISFVNSLFAPGVTRIISLPPLPCNHPPIRSSPHHSRCSPAPHPSSFPHHSVGRLAASDQPSLSPCLSLTRCSPLVPSRSLVRSIFVIHHLYAAR